MHSLYRPPRWPLSTTNWQIPLPQHYTWERVQLTTTSDMVMTQLICIVESGFPKFRHELLPAIQVYHQFREHLYTVDVWCPPLQGPDSHCSFAAPIHPDYTPLITPRCDLNDCMCRKNSILARHHCSHQSHEGELPPLQQHGTLADPVPHPTHPSHQHTPFKLHALIS